MGLAARTRSGRAEHCPESRRGLPSVGRTVGRSGAFQGQVFGFSTAATVTDENCERIKLARSLYGMDGRSAQAYDGHLV